MRKILVSFRRWAAILCLALAVINLHSATVLGSSIVASVPPTGELTLAGSVHVDGAPSVSGQTFFTGSTIAVAAASHSTLVLSSHGRLELSAETILKLDFTNDQIKGALKSGRLRIYAPAGVNARLMTEDATFAADSGQMAIFSVESVRDGGTTVSVEAGQVSISFGERRQLLNAGESLSTTVGSGSGSSGRPHLGSVKRNMLEFGLVGVLSIITLLLAGNGGGQEPLCFGGTIGGLSPVDNPPVPPPTICR
jgi:hypothetical protein